MEKLRFFSIALSLYLFMSTKSRGIFAHTAIAGMEKLKLLLSDFIFIFTGASVAQVSRVLFGLFRIIFGGEIHKHTQLLLLLAFIS